MTWGQTFPGGAQAQPSDVPAPGVTWGQIIQKTAPVAPQNAAPSTQPLTPMQAFTAGMGREFVKGAAGVSEALTPTAEWLEKEFPGVSQWAQSHGFPSAQQAQANDQAAVTQANTTGAPLAHGWGLAGGTLAQGAMAVPEFAAAGERVIPNAVAGGVAGYLQPTTEGNTRLGNTAAGAVMGAGSALAMPLIAKVAQPFEPVVDAARKKAIAVLDAAGVPLEAAQRTGAHLLERFRSATVDNPITSGAQAQFRAAQDKAYNKAVLATIGRNATAATPDVLSGIANKIGGVFQDVIPKAQIPVTPELEARVGQIAKNATLEEKTPIANKAGQFLGSAGPDGKIPGPVAYTIKKDLDRMASSPDSSLAYHARELRSAVLDSVNNGLSPEDAASLTEARGQFRKLKQIEGAIDREGKGNISPARLSATLSTAKNRGATLYGRGDQSLIDLAHAGNLLLPPKDANSGTTARAALQAMWPLVAAGVGAAGHGDAGAVLGGVAGETMPWMIQKAAHSPGVSQYLANGLRQGPIRDLLMSTAKPGVGTALNLLPEAYVHATQSRRGTQ